MTGSNYTVATAAQLVGTTKSYIGEPMAARLESAGAANMARKEQRSESKKKQKRPQTPTDIYFSPVLNGSKATLGSPQSTPPATPTQKSYNAEQGALRIESAGRRQTKRPAKGKLTLAPEQLDQLVAALAKAPIIQNHVRRQWWEGKEKFDDEDSTASRPSSVLSGRRRKVSSPGYIGPRASSLYSTKNQPVLTTQPQSKSGGILLADARVTGSPVRLRSKDYPADAKAPQFGQCSYLNITYGSSVEAHIRFEPSTTNARSPGRVVLQIVNQVLDRKTDRKNCYLAADIDVTESFTKAALVELAAGTDMSLDDIDIVTVTARDKHDSTEDVDWCALANELEALCSIDQVTESALELFAALSKETCSMATLTLLSELGRIVSRHQDFVVVRSYEQHGNGAPARMGVPWISQHFARTLHGDCPLPPESVQRFREALVREVAAAPLDETFTTWVKWDGERAKVHCVPLIEEAQGKTVAWACFVRDDYEF